MNNATRLSFGLFLMLFGVYLLTFSGHIYTIDGYQYYAMTESLVEKGSFAIPPVYMSVQGNDGRSYSKLGKGQSILAIPLYAAGKIFRKVLPESVIVQMNNAQQKIVAIFRGSTSVPAFKYFFGDTPPDPLNSFFVLLLSPLITAACMALLLYLLRLSGYSPATAIWVTIITAFSTYFWPSSRDFFSHPAETALLLCTVLGRLRLDANFKYRSFFFMGTCCALALTVRIATIIWIPIFSLSLIYVFLKHKTPRKQLYTSLLLYWVPCIFSAALLMLLNYNLFGSVFKTGYHTTYDNGFSTPLLFGIYENLLNPHKSFFVFAPPALLACFGLKAFLKKQKTLGTIAIAVFFSYLLLYSKWWAASGGLCLGPRFLLPTVPLMMMPLAELFAPANISHKRWLRIIIPVAILGMLLQLVWMSIDYTSVSQLLHGNFLQIFNYVEILYKTGPRALDFWYINMLGEIPLVWYLLAITPPLVCFVSGIILMRSQRFQP